MFNLDFIAFPLGKFLLFIYENLAFHRYGIAIIIFTVMIRILLMPLMIKQYTSMSKMQEIQPQLQEIQKRYKNDKEKLNMEMMKLYQENKINPMGGCLPLLVQMPILFSLYYVIYSPLKYMLKVGAPDSKVFIAKEITDKLVTFQGNARIQPAIDALFNEATKAAKALNIVTPAAGSNHDIFVINFFSTHKTSLTNVGDMLNMNFFNLNLGLIPKWNPQEIFNGGMQYLPLIIIPILAVVTTYISIRYSMTQQNKNSGSSEMAATMNKSMTLMMPIMTGFMAFSVPAGLGLYWIINNIVQIFQQMFMNKFIVKKNKEVEGS